MVEDSLKSKSFSGRELELYESGQFNIITKITELIQVCKKEKLNSLKTLKTIKEFMKEFSL